MVECIEQEANMCKERIEHCNGLGDRNKLGNRNKLGDHNKLGNHNGLDDRNGFGDRKGSATATQHTLERTEHDST